MERKIYSNGDWVRELVATKNGRVILTLIRIVLFPVMLLVRLFRWTYHYED